MKNISLFKNFITGIGSQNLAQIIEEIKGDHYKLPVSKIRALVNTGDHKNADQLKKELVTFTVSGLFGSRPKMTALKIYNPFVILDINELDPVLLPYLVLKIKEIEFTKGIFTSPSGRGLKVIVEVDSEMEMHRMAYQQVSNFYKKKLGIEIEKNGGRITQLCFMSHDPEAYFNSKSAIYKIKESEFEISIDEEPIDIISEHPEKKIRKGSTVLPPAIPLQVYRKLPALLRKSCKPFNDRFQERDIFLTGALGLLSGMLSDISGIYDDQVCHPNLFVFVTTPAASSKDAFKLARYLGTAYQKQLSKANKKQQDDYREALAKYERDLWKYKKGDLIKASKVPTKPVSKNLFLPSPINAINLVEYLNLNEESGVLFESEVDSLGNVVNKNWGEYSNILKKPFITNLFPIAENQVIIL